MHLSSRFETVTLVAAAVLLVACAGLDVVRAADAELVAGFAVTDISPQVGGVKPVWLAGYGWGRAATSVHDPLFARAVYLRDKQGMEFAFVSVDLVGLQFPQVEETRRALPDLDYLMIGSTHNHEGPDTIGIWGKTPLQTGVDGDYLSLVVSRIAEAVNEARAASRPVHVAFGTATDESLLGDSRKPYAKDGVLRVLRFDDADSGATTGILVQWNCHPEAMGSQNQAVTADFCYATIQQLERKYDCKIAYFTGAVGGLMAPPDGRFKNEAGRTLREGEFAYAEAYGQAVATLAEQAIESAAPITLTPFQVAYRSVAIPVRNGLYRTARVLGIVRREGVLWTGDFRVADRPAIPVLNQTYAVRSEIGCARMGDLVTVAIPGELYPELVYGQFQEPVEPNVDFPDAPLEPTIQQLVPSGKKWLLFGLANDEIGYIIPKRQWDLDPPFAYGRTKPQYGEVNSCGVDVAPIVMQAVAERLADLGLTPSSN
ncbi:MAG: hypothetical protein CMJ80_05640 [Planctomycetaceae bacterium]|nr:hypothetical protein [Planctomycetaceae bacterium]